MRRERKKWNSEPENTDRWLISYADFVTLLFAFFTVLYALSTINETKYLAISTALSSAFSEPKSSTIVELSAGMPIGEGLSRGSIAGSFRRAFSSDFKMISSELAALSKLDNVDVTVSERGVVISVAASSLFSRGSARLKKSGKPVLSEVGGVLVILPNYYRVEAHTDNAKRGKSKYSTNWELSSARATAVARYFVDKRAAAPEKISATGYGRYRPLATNATEIGRSLNNRVDILILNKENAAVEPT